MKWDLTYLFKTEEDFKQSLGDIEALIDTMASYKNKLNNEKDFVDYLLKEKELEEKLGRSYQYASLKSDLNKKDVNALNNLNKCQMLIYSLNEKCAFQDPEILELGKDKVMSFIDNNNAIEEFRFPMEKLFNEFEHVLDQNSERLLSYYSPLTAAGASLFSSLTVGDSTEKDVKLANMQYIKVNQSNFQSLIGTTLNARDRRKIFEAIYDEYASHKNVLADIYKTVLDADKAEMKARNFDSSLSAHLSKNKIPLEVYYNLVEVASSNTEAVKRYLKLRKKYLKLSTYHTYDRFLPLAKSTKKYTYEEAKKLFFDSIEKFPADFVAKAHQALEDGFVDVNIAEGKRSGAYSSGMANLHPYILLNHDSSLESAFTLAHESGHSIHTLYAMESQPTMLQDYTIFVAEIASTFNEHNLLDYFLQQSSTTKEEKIMVLQKAIDSIISTFYRQTLFAEYELRAHEANEKGEPINHETLSNIMIELYEKYYGLDINKEKVKKYVWAYIPHLFYTPFYVYQYATSFAASFKLYKDVKENGEEAFNRYINLLKAGGSKYPMEEVKEAGVDFTEKSSFLAVVERMEELVNKLEDLIKDDLKTPRKKY